MNIPVTIELGPPLYALGDLPQVKSFLRDLTDDLAAWLRQVGLEGQPQLRVQPIDMTRAVRLRVHNRRVSFSPKLMRRIWAASTSPEWRGFPDDPAHTNSPAAFAFPDGWLADFLEDKNISLDVASRQDLALTFLHRLVVEALRERPSSLVGPAQADLYWQAGAGEAHPCQAHMLLVLKALLDLWVPTSDPKLVCQTLLQVCDRNCPPEDAVEALFTRLHARRIEIHMNPSYIRQILPEVPTRGSLSVYDERLPQNVRDVFQLLADGIFYDLGLRLPDIFLVPSLHVPENAIQIKLNERIRPPIQGLRPDELLVNATVDYLKGLNIPARLAKRPNDDTEIAIVELSQRQAIEADDIYIWDPLGTIVLALTGELNDGGAEKLLGQEEVEYEIAQLEQDFPNMVRPVLERYSLEDITRVLRGLVRENVSIQNLPVILERLLLFETIPADASLFFVLDDRLPIPEWLPGEAANSWQNYLEFVRMGLADQLAEKYKDSNGSLSVYLMPPEVDRRLKQMSRGVWERWDLTPAQDAWLEGLRDALWREVRNASMEMRRTPLLAPAGLRLPLRGWLAAEFPSLPVLSYHEIPMGINVTPISRIEV
jgi:hypothetical protein